MATLASIGPIVAFFSMSTASHSFMILVNVVVFTISGALGLSFLLQTLHRLSVAPHYPKEASEDPYLPDPSQRPPGALEPLDGQVLGRHVKTVFRCWVVLFGLVGAQMGWVLRPFVGDPNSPFTLFRARGFQLFPGGLERPDGCAVVIPLWKQAEAVLRGRPGGGSWPLVLGCGLAYGLVMGAFDGHPAQAVLSAIKVPLLLIATMLLSLPSFFVLNTLLGVRDDFAEAWKAVIASQACLTIILVSLAPLTAFWYASSSNYRSAIYFNDVDLRGRQSECPVDAPPHVSPFDRTRPEASLVAPDMAHPLRVRGDPDGLEPSSFYRSTGPAHPFLPRRRLGECLHRRHPDVLEQSNQIGPTYFQEARIVRLACSGSIFSMDGVRSLDRNRENPALRVVPTITTSASTTRAISPMVAGMSLVVM